MNIPATAIRAVAAEHVVQLAALDASAGAYPWQEARFRTVFGGGATGAALEEHGQITGFIISATVGDEATVLNIAVHPQYQRGGRAARLLAVVLEQMRESGVRRCLLEVRASNAAARRLYERHGFTVDGVRKDYYPLDAGREDAILMSLEVRSKRS